MSTKRLYGAPGDDWLDHDLWTAAERIIDGRMDDDATEFVVEEWDVHPPDYPIPTAEIIVDYVLERTADDAPHEGVSEDLPPITSDMLGAAEALRQAIASRIKFTLAKSVVGTHVLRRLPDDAFETWEIGEGGGRMTFGQPREQQSQDSEQ